MEYTEEAPASFRSSAYRPGPIGLVAEALTETWSRRRLIRYLVQADLKKKGADTLLGNVWWVLDPLLQMLVYVILISVILNRSRAIADYPLFIFSAILPWKWFTSSVNDAITSVVGQERLIKQIHFPKVVLPVASTVAGIANFAFGLIPLAALLLIFYPSHTSGYIVLIPIIAAVQFLFTLAFSFVVSGINVFYRDVANVSRHFLRLWFYLSPALYSTKDIDALGEKNPVVAQIMLANPFATFFESYRNVIYNGTQPLWGHLAVWTLLSLGLLGLTTLLFKRVEPAFAKVL